MKVLVTGGSGLVGYSLKKIVKDKECDIIFVNSKNYNLENVSEVDAMLKKIKPDCVIHLAANVGGLYKNLDNNLDIFESNLLINFNIIKKCHENNVQKVISCLSTCIYPDKITYPINESKIHDGPPHNSNYGYSYSKRLLEIHSRLYREKFNRDYMCVIPTNIYGENDNYNLKNSHVIPALIHKCYLSKKNNTDFIVNGSGKALRQFIFSDDLAKIIFDLATRDKIIDNVIISVPENKEISIKNLALMIAKKFDYNNHVKFDSSYSDGQYKKTVSNNLLTNKIDNIVFTDLEEGLDITIKYFIENYDSIRK